MKWKRKRDNVWIHLKLKMVNERKKNNELIQIVMKTQSFHKTHQRTKTLASSLEFYISSTWIVFTCSADHAFLYLLSTQRQNEAQKRH